MNSRDQALAFARGRASSGAQYPEGNCLGFVRDAWGSPAFGGDAAGAYAKTTDRDPNQGLLAWWLYGMSGHGHVAIPDGNGNVYTTDFGPLGFIGDGRVRCVPIPAISSHDPALKFAGFSNDLDGVTLLEALMLVLKDFVHPSSGNPPLYLSLGDYKSPISYAAYQALAAAVPVTLKEVHKTGEPLYALLNVPTIGVAPPAPPAGDFAAKDHKHTVTGTVTGAAS